MLRSYLLSLSLLLHNAWNRIQCGNPYTIYLHKAGIYVLHAEDDIQCIRHRAGPLPRNTLYPLKTEYVTCLHSQGHDILHTRKLLLLLTRDATHLSGIVVYAGTVPQHYDMGNSSQTSHWHIP